MFIFLVIMFFSLFININAGICISKTAKDKLIKEEIEQEVRKSLINIVSEQIESRLMDMINKSLIEEMNSLKNLHRYKDLDYGEYLKKIYIINNYSLPLPKKLKQQIYDYYKQYANERKLNYTRDSDEIIKSAFIERLKSVDVHPESIKKIFEEGEKPPRKSKTKSLTSEIIDIDLHLLNIFLNYGIDPIYRFPMRQEEKHNRMLNKGYLIIPQEIENEIVAFIYNGRLWSSKERYLEGLESFFRKNLIYPKSLENIKLLLKALEYSEQEDTDLQQDTDDEAFSGSEDEAWDLS